MKLKQYGVLITIEEDYDSDRKSRYGGEINRYFKRIVKRFDKREDMMKHIKKIVRVIGKETL